MKREFVALFQPKGRMKKIRAENSRKFAEAFLGAYAGKTKPQNALSTTICYFVASVFTFKKIRNERSGRYNPIK